MAGFAVVVGANAEVGWDREFGDFLQHVAGFKSLEKPGDYATGKHCIGAKLDSPASLHRGITIDRETGSWLMAAGTVVDTRHVAPDGDLGLLLQDYLIHGASVFERCDGLFALVVYNGSTQSLAVITDPFGYFSVFYGIRDGRTFVSTSALAIARQIGSAPDHTGVSCFLRTGKVFGNMTLWHDVKRLRAATALEFAHGTMRELRYWVPAVDEPVANLSFAESVEVSMEVLQHVLKRNLEREGKVWTDLTGGFDTRLLAMVLERAGIPFKANSVGPSEHPDVRIARTIVSKTGWDYQHFELPETWPQECPHYLKDALGMGDAHLDVLSLARPLWASRQRVGQYTTLLNGLGGEMWRGPIWWPEGANLGKSTVVNYDRQFWSLTHPIPDAIFVTDPTDRVREEVIGQFKCVGEQYPDLPNSAKLDYVWTYRETAHVGAWGSFLSSVLRSIPPLFSKDIVTHVISLSYRWKVRNQLVRRMLERYRPVLANLEVEGRGPAVPRRITNFYRFIPARVNFYRKAANKLGEIILGKSLGLANRHTGYSLVEWRQEILRFAEAERLFHPSEMRSGNLYNLDQLRTFLSQAQTEKFQYDEFLGWVITVEMALRAVGAASD